MLTSACLPFAPDTLKEAKPHFAGRDFRPARQAFSTSAATGRTRRCTARPSPAWTKCPGVPAAGGIGGIRRQRGRGLRGHLILMSRDMIDFDFSRWQPAASSSNGITSSDSHPALLSDLSVAQLVIAYISWLFERTLKLIWLILERGFRGSVQYGVALWS